MRRGATAGGSYYSAKKWGGGAIAPPAPSPFTYAPDKYHRERTTKQIKKADTHKKRMLRTRHVHSALVKVINICTVIYSPESNSGSSKIF